MPISMPPTTSRLGISGPGATHAGRADAIGAEIMAAYAADEVSEHDLASRMTELFDDPTVGAAAGTLTDGINGGAAMLATDEARCMRDRGPAGERNCRALGRGVNGSATSPFFKAARQIVHVHRGNRLLRALKSELT